MREIGTRGRRRCGRGSFAMTEASVAAAGNGDAVGHPPIDLFLDPGDTADGNGNGRGNRPSWMVGVDAAAKPVRVRTCFSRGAWFPDPSARSFLRFRFRDAM